MTDRPKDLDEDEGAPIAAAATLPVGRGRGRGRGGGLDGEGGGDSSGPPGSGNGPRRRWSLPKLLLGAVILIGVLTVVPALTSSVQKTPRDRVGISYGGGPIEGVHFQRVVSPGHALFVNGLFDSLFLYPSDQQNYIVEPTTEDSPSSIVAPSRDRIQVGFQVAVYFKLNIDELRAFHEQFGLRYRAYTDGGWDNLIDDTLRQQLESTLQEQMRRYDVADIYSDVDVLSTLQSDVQTSLTARLRTALGGSYFCGPTYQTGGRCPPIAFVIKRIVVPDTVVNAFERNRTSEIDIQTRTNEVAQRQAEADAIEALREELQAVGDDYVLLRAIESDKINFWVLPSDSGLTLQAPDPTATPDSTEAAPADSGSPGG